MAATVDTTRLFRDLARLVRGITDGGQDAARRQADDTARAIAAGTPRRTGALAASAGTVKVGDGYAVTYGAGIPYVGAVENRAHAQRNALQSVDRRFVGACRDVATREANAI